MHRGRRRPVGRRGQRQDRRRPERRRRRRRALPGRPQRRAQRHPRGVIAWLEPLVCDVSLELPEAEAARLRSAAPGPSGGGSRAGALPRPRPGAGRTCPPARGNTSSGSSARAACPSLRSPWGLSGRPSCPGRRWLDLGSGPGAAHEVTAAVLGGMPHAVSASGPRLASRKEILTGTRRGGRVFPEETNEPDRVADPDSLVCRHVPSSSRACFPPIPRRG